ncbi:MAG TPA: hypothetical protein PKE48_05345, partial [Anaerolineales bacterium]|nr:hypothetical protein [Anaerolineales bacterium]
AADRKDFLLLIAFDQIDAIDPRLGHVVRGRQALFNNNLQEAQLQLAEAEKLEPKIPEMFLLKAEIALRNGNTSEARTIFNNTLNNPATPAWMRLMIEELLKTMQ